MSDMDVCGLGIVGTDYVQSTSHPTIIFVGNITAHL